MFARASTIHANPDLVDTGIAHIEGEVLPALKAIDGFVGLSMMADRETGMCIVTTSWLDAEAMSASAEAARPLRHRAATVLGGTASASVEEWEIAVMHRDHSSHTGACVRSVWLRAAPRRLDDLIEVYKTTALPKIDELPGFCSASFMINRSTGRAVSSTCFENHEALEASRMAAAQIRAAGSRQVDATVNAVHEFELAVAHLRVPELA